MDARKTKGKRGRVYWCVYIGRDRVTFGVTEAKWATAKHPYMMTSQARVRAAQLYTDALNLDQAARADANRKGSITLSQLAEDYLTDQHKRRLVSVGSKRSQLGKFLDHKAGIYEGERLVGHGERLRYLRADMVKSQHLEEFLDWVEFQHEKAPHPYQKAIKAMFSWGERNEKLPNFTSFRGSPNRDPDLDIPQEEELLKPFEVNAILEWARAFDPMECDTPETLEVVKPKLIRQIKTRRLTLGLTGKALADQSGVSRASISEIENARHIPTLSTFSKLAGVLGITVQVVETDRNQQGRGRPRTKAPADLWAFFRLILLTGARPGEIIAATIFNYSRKAECITLKTHKTSKKTRKPRIIRLSKEACQLCDKLTAGRKTGPLLPAIDGGHVRRDSVTTVYRAWKDDKKEVRQHHHLNAFRHLWISNLLVEGVPIFEVSAMAGTSVREIERTYGHFCKRQSADAFRKLEQSHRASGIQ